QEVQIVWSRDPAAREAVTRCVVDARLATFDWGRPYLPAAFGAEDVARTLLRTAYGAEIRPERGERIESMIDAQRTTLIAIFETLLETLAQVGVGERRVCKPTIMDTARNPVATAAAARSDLDSPQPDPPAPAEPI